MHKKFNIKDIIGNKDLKPIEESIKEDRTKAKTVLASEIGNEEFLVEQFIYDLICTSSTTKIDKNNDLILTTKVVLMDPVKCEVLCNAFNVTSNITDIRKTGDCSAGRISCKSNVGNMLTSIIQMVMPGLCIPCVAPAWKEGESLADLVERTLDNDKSI